MSQCQRHILVLIAIADKPSGRREQRTRVAAGATKSSNCLTSLRRVATIGPDFMIAMPLSGTCQQMVQETTMIRQSIHDTRHGD